MFIYDILNCGVIPKMMSFHINFNHSTLKPCFFKGGFYFEKMLLITCFCSKFYHTYPYISFAHGSVVMHLMMFAPNFDTMAHVLCRIARLIIHFNVYRAQTTTGNQSATNHDRALLHQCYLHSQDTPLFAFNRYFVEHHRRNSHKHLHLLPPFSFSQSIAIWRTNLFANVTTHQHSSSKCQR